MKLTIQTRNIPPADSFETLIENRLLALGERFEIHDATVLVERRHDASPQYRAVLHVAVPGPDLRCERIDHSPAQALYRVLDEAESRISARVAARRLEHGKNRLRTAGSRYPRRS